MKRNHELASGLLLHDANCSITYVGPCHAVHVATALAGIEHQRERETLLCADRPMLFKCRDFGIRPRADFLRLGSFDAERWIMVKPSNVDRMPDQDAQNLEDRKRGARPVSVGLEDAGEDPLTRQARDRAVAVLCPKRLDTRAYPTLSSVAGPDTPNCACTRRTGRRWAVGGLTCLWRLCRTDLPTRPGTQPRIHPTQPRPTATTGLLRRG